MLGYSKEFYFSVFVAAIALGLSVIVEGLLQWGYAHG